jgi:hypothetical protein
MSLNANSFCKATTNDGTGIRIGEVRFSYPKLFKADPESGKYSLCVLISKDNTKAIDLIKKATQAAAQNGAQKFWSGKIPPTLKKPLRDGDEEHPDDPAFANCYFFNCSNQYPPKVGMYDDDLGARVEATELDVYAGSYGLVTVQFYPFNTNGNRGVGASLGNVLKTRDGDRLAGSSESLDDSFGDLD